jgi:hypothetical protein
LDLSFDSTQAVLGLRAGSLGGVLGQHVEHERSRRREIA